MLLLAPCLGVPPDENVLPAAETEDGVLRWPLTVPPPVRLEIAGLDGGGLVKVSVDELPLVAEG